MFKLFGHKKAEADNQVYAPVNGELVDISEVSDPVFAQKAMGEGFGVKPSDGNILAPVAGKVTMVATTKHAVGFTMDNGLEVLVHMGVDTVDLKGAPFTIAVNVGDNVKGGQKIAAIDLEQIKAAQLDDVIIVVFTNSGDKLDRLNVTPGSVEAGAVVGDVTTK